MFDIPYYHLRIWQTFPNMHTPDSVLPIPSCPIAVSAPRHVSISLLNPWALKSHLSNENVAQNSKICHLTSLLGNIVVIFPRVGGQAGIIVQKSKP